jgi:DNA-binding beta-propeller fold protein YncE
MMGDADVKMEARIVNRTWRARAVIFVLLSVFVFALPSFSPCAGLHSLRFEFAIEGFYKDRFDSPVGIFVDREHGEVFVADSARGEVLLFDSEGTPIHRFGKLNGIRNPIDIVARNDRIYVSQEGNPYIDVLNFTGKPVGRLAPLKIPFYPGKMDIDGDGNIFVVNKARAESVVFDSEDRFVGTIGEGLKSISGVAVSADRVYLLTPADGQAVQVYNKSGEFIMAFEGIEGRGGRLGLPASAKVDGEGRLWLVDALRGVFIYDMEGTRIAGFGWSGAPEGLLSFPVDIDFDSENRVYIVEKAKKSVSVFK